MHSLTTIRDACTQALTDGGSPDRFHAVVDPGSVMEMASMIEMLLTYIEKIDDLTAQELARETKHRLQGDQAEGGV